MRQATGQIPNISRPTSTSDASINRPANEQNLIDFVFERPFNKLASYQENRAILAPLNEDILRINETILKQIDGIIFTLNQFYLF